VSILFHRVSPSGAWYFEGPRGEGRDTIGYEICESHYPPPPSDQDVYEDDELIEGGRSFEHFYDYHFRIAPNNKVMIPFLTSFAKAAIHMPALRQAVLWSPIRWAVDGGDSDDESETDEFVTEAFDYFQPPEKFNGWHLAWVLSYYCPGGQSLGTRANTEDSQRSARQIQWRVGEWRPNSELHSLFQQIGRQEHGEALTEDWYDEDFAHGLVPRRYFEYLTPGR
jgi:hypothetical protein